MATNPNIYPDTSLTIPDIPSVNQQQSGFQTPTAPTVQKVDTTTPTQQTQPTSSLDYLSSLIGTGPSAEQEAEKERNLQRQQKIESLTNAFKLLGQSHYANQGYHVPRPTPDPILAATQAELARQKAAYSQNLAAYQARKAAVGSRLLSLQQESDIAKQRAVQEAEREANLANYRLGSLEDQKARIGEQQRHNVAMEQLRERKYAVQKNGDLTFNYGNQEVSIPKNKLVGIAVSIHNARKQLGLPTAENLQNIVGDLSIPANLNKIGWYVAQYYQYYNPPGQKQFNFTNYGKPETQTQTPSIFK